MSSGQHSATPDLAQHFTPEPVAEFMWRLAADLGSGDSREGRVIDPAAGEGALLMQAALHGVPAHNICGIEVDPGVSQAQVSGRVYKGDGLTGEFPAVLDASFDTVVGNPPFGRCRAAMSEEQLEAVLRGVPRVFEIWRGDGRPSRDASTRVVVSRASAGQRRLLCSAAIEHLFLERALQLVKPGGLVVFILPEGFLANSRTQRVRDWVISRAQVLAVVALPEGVFRRRGLSAVTNVVVLRRRGDADALPERVALAGDHSTRQPLAQALSESHQTVLRLRRAGRPVREVAGRSLAESCLRGSRWDVGFWREEGPPAGLHRGLRTAPLGDFIEHLTYGPIVTGRRPHHVDGGRHIIRQGDFCVSGLVPTPGLCVAAGSVYDPARSRTRDGDLLLPRSGAGSLGKNRMAVYHHPEGANIGCFVDLIRLRDLNPYFAWFYLRSASGWGQIRRLINGVGTPNISFSEIRSIRIPLIPDDLQSHLEDQYLQEVWPAHQLGDSSAGAARQAEAAFHRIVVELEAALRRG